MTDETTDYTTVVDIVRVALMEVPKELREASPCLQVREPKIQWTGEEEPKSVVAFYIEQIASAQVVIGLNESRKNDAKWIVRLVNGRFSAGLLDLAALYRRNADELENAVIKWASKK